MRTFRAVVLSLLIVVAKPAQFNEQGGSTPENNGEPDHHNLPVAGKTFASLVPPHARIAFIASAPNPKRWLIVDKVKKFNALAKDYCEKNGLMFVDVFPLMLGADGLPKPNIFRDDRLHMNTNGYAIWSEALRPYVK